jgi:hypothetical protein
MFNKSRAFFEQNYVIDYENNTVIIDHPKKVIDYIFDFIYDYFQKTSFWFLFSIIIFKIVSWIIYIPAILFAQISTNILLFYAFIFLIFNILFILFNNEWLINTQMFFEDIGLNMLFWKWQEKEFILNNTNQYTIEFLLYVKYKLFFNNLRDNVSKIDYKITQHPRRRLMTIYFNKPVTGKIKIKYRGEILNGGPENV